ncbi:hypothetical protein ABTZ21_33850 [Streptomyces sp. NPDC096191]|uniref:hypothetical protein n=1 Tax=Streptomyces sp. NPDC096191 TaxID=3155426 RepID=UPI003327B18E
MVAAPGVPVAVVAPTVLGMAGVPNVRVVVVRTVPGVAVAPTVPAAVAPTITVTIAPATTARWDRSGSCARRTCWWSTSTW